MIFETSDDGYDRFMGRYSARLAPLFAEFAGIRQGAHALDVGAGTGLLAAELERRGANVAAAEPAPQFVDALRRRLPDADVQEAPAEELPWPDVTFDAALAQLVISFTRDGPAAVAEMRRVVRPGGVVALCMWDRDALPVGDVLATVRATVAPDAPAPEPLRYRSADELAELLAGAGLAELRTATLEVEAEYRDLDDFWEAAVGAAGPSSSWLKALDGERRAAARDEADRLLGGPSGAFTLRARASAASATRA